MQGTLVHISVTMAPPWLPPELGLLVIDHLGAEAELDHDRLGPDAETNINPPFDDQVRLPPSATAHWRVETGYIVARYTYTKPFR